MKEAVEYRYLGKDFSDVLGQQEVVEKAVIAAAGGHNLLLIGEPGCGKSRGSSAALSLHFAKVPDATQLPHNFILCT